MTAEVGVPWDEIVICGELLKTEEKVVVASLEAPFQNLLGCTEEEHDEYHQCSVSTKVQTTYLMSTSEVCY
jgi:hypothetical protein